MDTIKLWYNHKESEFKDLLADQLGDTVFTVSHVLGDGSHEDPYTILVNTYTEGVGQLELGARLVNIVKCPKQTLKYFKETLDGYKARAEIRATAGFIEHELAKVLSNPSIKVEPFIRSESGNDVNLAVKVGSRTVYDLDVNGTKLKAEADKVIKRFVKLLRKEVSSEY